MAWTMGTLLLLLAVSAASAGSITREQCPSYDYSSRFGPVRDQDGHGLCWAFATAALLEEDLCLREPTTCGKTQLSVLDIARAEWGLGSKEEGSHPVIALRVTSHDGVCEESLAPYRSVHDIMCSVRDFLDNWGPSCLNGRLLKIYDQWAATNSGNCSRSNLESEQAYLFAKKISRLLPDHEGLEANFRAALAAPDRRAFLKKLLIPPACEKNRIPFKRQYLYTPYEDPEALAAGHIKIALKKKMADLISVLKSGRSTGASICARKLLRKAKTTECGGHGVVITGMKWDEKSSSCQVQLRNSWGKKGRLHGWHDAEELLRYTVDMTSLR